MNGPLPAQRRSPLDPAASRLSNAAGFKVGGAPMRAAQAADPLSRRSVKRGLVLALTLGVLLRVGLALPQGDTALPLPGIYDQVSYDALARRVLAGQGFTFGTDWWPATRAGEPTAHWSYLYTLYLAASNAIFGLHPLAARLIQATVAGLLQPWLAWRIGSRVFGERAGLMAAGLSAIYLYFVYYAGALMTETFTILALLWTLDLAVTLGRPTPADAPAPREPLQTWLALGLALGLAALLRQVTLLFLPFLIAWLLWARTRPWPTRAGAPGGGRSLPVRELLGALLIVAAMILPWTVHNYRAFNRPVLLNTNAGFAFFWANHPIHGTSFIPILPPETYRALIPPELIPLDEASLDAALLRRGLEFVAEDPLRYARLSLSRSVEFFKFWPSPESGLLSNLSRVLSFGIALPFILWGLTLAAREIRAGQFSGDASAAILLYLFVMVYTMIHLLSWALIRYRLPVDAILVLFAALPLARITMQPATGEIPTGAARGS